jgi:hypothetical protein
MEVHHAHHPAHKKKWNEYILEFVIVNRQHKVDKI